MDLQRKADLWLPSKDLEGINCKDLILEMLDRQTSENLESFLDKRFSADSYAEWA